MSTDYSRLKIYHLAIFLVKKPGAGIKNDSESNTRPAGSYFLDNPAGCNRFINIRGA